MLKQRVITASILALLVIWAVLKLPATGFGLALLTIILPGAWEWTRLVGLAAPRDRGLYVGGVLLLILAIWPLLDHTALMSGLLSVVVLSWCGALLWLLPSLAGWLLGRSRTVVLCALLLPRRLHLNLQHESPYQIKLSLD